MKHKIKMNVFSLETDRKSSIKHPRWLIYFKHTWGGLKRDGGLI